MIKIIVQNRTPAWLSGSSSLTQRQADQWDIVVWREIVRAQHWRDTLGQSWCSGKVSGILRAAWSKGAEGVWTDRRGPLCLAWFPFAGGWSRESGRVLLVARFGEEAAAVGSRRALTPRRLFCQCLNFTLRSLESLYRVFNQGNGMVTLIF